MIGIERTVVYFRKLLFETDNEKFSLRRVKSKKVSRHPGGNELQSSLEVGGRYLSQSYEDGRRKKAEYHLHKGSG